MRFVQTIRVKADDPGAIAQLMAEWHAAEAGRAPGYEASRLLADRDNPGRYMVAVYFSSAEEAEANNDRPETQQWAERFNAVIDGEPEFSNFDELSYTG